MSTKISESEINRYYYNPKNPGSYSSPSKLYRTLRNTDQKSPSLHQLKKWMEKNDDYNLLKPTTRINKRIKVVVKGQFDQYDADLADMSSISKQNKGFKYLLIVIDVFSRFLWIKPLKTKRGTEVTKALKFIFTEGATPQKFRTDGGSEFSNKDVQAYLKRLKIYHHIARNDAKANYAERVILTIKQRLWRYFIKNRTHRYIDIIQDVVKKL